MMVIIIIVSNPSERVAEISITYFVLPSMFGTELINSSTSFLIWSPARLFQPLLFHSQRLYITHVRRKSIHFDRRFINHQHTTSAHTCAECDVRML